MDFIWDAKTIFYLTGPLHKENTQLPTERTNVSYLPFICKERTACTPQWEYNQGLEVGNCSSEIKLKLLKHEVK